MTNCTLQCKRTNMSMKSFMYLPYNFRVDDQDYIEDPFGMNASRMEVDVNIIMTQKSNLSNLKKAVRSAGVEIDGIVLSGYASAIATMG